LRSNSFKNSFESSIEFFPDIQAFVYEKQEEYEKVPVQI
jgi:hypothetical protein